MIGRPGPWTTAADLAELDCAILALVDCHAWHRQDCATCIAGWPPCKRKESATEAVIAWWERRCLLSRAQFLGTLQNRREAA